MILIISGSPRKGNTDYLCNIFKREVERVSGEVRIIKISNYNIKPCISCRNCIETGECMIKDDMEKIFPLLINADAIVIVSPVYFNNVTAQLKAFMDRTWCMRGKLKNKVGGAIVVGRRYGHEMAVNAIHSFMLKHEMILGMRGVVAIGYEEGDVKNDEEGLKDVKKLAKRVVELVEIMREWGKMGYPIW